MKIKTLSKYILMSITSLMVVNLLSSLAYGQESRVSKVDANESRAYEGAPDKFSFGVRVVDSTILMSGRTTISLWGIEAINLDTTVFHLKSRNALEKMIAGQNVLCTVKNRESTDIIRAQCINSMEEDLSLFLLRQGYVSADRAEIYGTIYEAPYLFAEEQAQLTEVGAWAHDQQSRSSSGDIQSKNFMIGAFFLMFVFVLALGVLSFYIMRGFGRVVDIQNQSIDLAAKERTLKDKEKYIIASMINSEMKENKSKIEAYLMIYEEVLQDFFDKDKTPKYKKTGEVIQKQPVLSRSVFDGNTHKLDVFGAILASDIIHYYARIKTMPDYIEIAPDMPEDEAREIIKDVVENTKKLHVISNDLEDKFRQNALIKRI